MNAIMGIGDVKKSGHLQVVKCYGFAYYDMIECVHSISEKQANPVEMQTMLIVKALGRALWQ